MRQNLDKALEKLKFGENQNASGILSSKIKNMIISDELSEGFIFPNENAFCALLGVGRGTLRDAYKELEALGYITRTKRGTYVNSKDVIASKASLATNMSSANSTELMEFRKMFEAETARLAALRANEDDLKAISNALEGMIEATDASTQSKCDSEFHLCVAKAAHNSLIETSMHSIIGYFQSFTLASLSEDEGTQGPATRISHAIWFHTKILEAIKEKDPENAQKYMIEHIIDVNTKTKPEK